MNAQLARPKYESTGVVVPLFRDNRMTSVLPEMAAGSRIEERIEDLIARLEAAGYQAVVQKDLMPSRSPFDAVYLSALRPDRDFSAACVVIQSLASIEDRSGEIEFDDGLD